MAMGGSIVIEAMPRYKSYGKPSKFSKTSSTYPRKFNSTPSTASRNSRPQQNLPLRLRKKIRKMPSSAPPSPRPFSPKRTSDDSGGRPKKQNKIDSRDIPTHFKGLKLTEKHGLENLQPPREPQQLKRPFDGFEGKNRFSGWRPSLLMLDDGNLDEESRLFSESNWPAIIEYNKKLVRAIEIDRARMSPKAQRGFSNLTGVLCYRSALLQSLLHIPELVSLLCAHSSKKCASNNPKFCLGCNFHRLAISYWRYTDPAPMQKYFGNLHNTLNHRGWPHKGQADPDEMLSFFFKLLLEDLSTTANTQIDAIFMSFFNQQIVCPCGHISETIKKQAKITVSLAPMIERGTLRQYFVRGQRDKVSGYRCDGCNKIQDVQKIGKLDYSAEILTIFTPRIDEFTRKIMHKVDTPEILDLTVLKGNTNTDVLKYELISLIQHRGNEGGGHYVCSAAGPDGKWNMYNDQMVTKCEKGAVSRGFTPVMCFYRRVKTPSSGK